MIPLSDDNPTKTKPYVVYFLIIANIIIFIYDRMTAINPWVGGLFNWSMVPKNVITGQPVVMVYPINPVQAIKITYEGLNPVWLTIFTSMFMHGGFLHIAGNMLSLWIFGNNIEDALGHVKFIIVYLLCGVAAAYTHIFFSFISGQSEIPTVGASGAIAGILGAYLYLYPTANVNTLVLLGFFWTIIEVPAVIFLGVWFFIQLTGLAPSLVQAGGGVAYGAHVGGFIAGFIIIILLGGRNLIGPRQIRLRRYKDDITFPW